MLQLLTDFGCFQNSLTLSEIFFHRLAGIFVVVFKWSGEKTGDVQIFQNTHITLVPSESHRYSLWLFCLVFLYRMVTWQRTACNLHTWIQKNKEHFNSWSWFTRNFEIFGGNLLIDEVQMMVALWKSYIVIRGTTELRHICVYAEKVQKGLALLF